MKSNVSMKNLQEHNIVFFVYLLGLAYQRTAVFGAPTTGIYFLTVPVEQGRWKAETKVLAVLISSEAFHLGWYGLSFVHVCVLISSYKYTDHSGFKSIIMPSFN